MPKQRADGPFRWESYVRVGVLHQPARKGERPRSPDGFPTVNGRGRGRDPHHRRSFALNPSLQIIGVGTVAFVSTSVDNLAVLVALFSARQLRPRRVALGYLGAIWIVAGAAWGGSKLLNLVLATDFGFLGVIPLGLGITRAWGLRRFAPDIAAPVPATGGAVATALVTLAQSTDNAVVFLSLFADTANELDARLFTTLAGCALVWCAFAFWLARHSPLAGILQRAMRFMLPFVLIAVGMYILSNTVTDVLAR